MDWVTAVLNLVGSGSKGAAPAGSNGGVGGASGYGLANTASVSTGAKSGPYMSSSGDARWMVTTGGAKASASQSAVPNEYLIVGGLIVAVILWKKMK